MDDQAMVSAVMSGLVKRRWKGTTVKERAAIMADVRKHRRPAKPSGKRPRAKKS